MAFHDEKDGERRRKTESDGDGDQIRTIARKKRAPAPEVGNALRTVYQRTIDEDIPPEFLDLLGKLG